jgi:hypothetical protein
LSKRYEEDIEVTPDPVDASAPLSFKWRGRRYEIDQRMSSWREGGRWWLAAGTGNGRATGTDSPRDREYHRVLARPAGALATGDLDPDGFMRSPSAVYDLFFDRVARAWKLARIWD